jgi:hypothetical protein
MRLTITLWHGEHKSWFYVFDSEVGDIVESCDTRIEAEHFRFKALNHVCPYEYEEGEMLCRDCPGKYCVRQ